MNTTNTQPASIENLYNKFVHAHNKNRPVNEHDKETLAALAASADLATTKWVVIRSFKSGGKNWQAGEVYPVEPDDRAEVIRLCKNGFILSDEEHKRGQIFQANKEKIERVRKLYQDLQTARNDVPQKARQVDQARLDLATAEGEHADAVRKLAALENALLPLLG